MTMVGRPRLGSGTPKNFNSLLVFAAANVTGAVNHWLASFACQWGAAVRGPHVVVRWYALSGAVLSRLCHRAWADRRHRVGGAAVRDRDDWWSGNAWPATSSRRGRLRQRRRTPAPPPRPS